MPPELNITSYALHPPHCDEYDPSATEVAARVRESVTDSLPEVTVEHIRHQYDILLAGTLQPDPPHVAATCPLRHGSQPAPLLAESAVLRIHAVADRPLRVGALEHKGRIFRLHVHVIAADSPEVAMLRAFRERLLADPSLMRAYVDCKRSILARGITDWQLYTGLKSAFVQEVLASR